MTTPWQPFREPLRSTLLRTMLIALVAGAIISRLPATHLRWPLATLLALWPSFGGHWVELWFLNWLRPRISSARSTQIAARALTWFVAGAVFALGACYTVKVVTGFPPARWPALWIGGVAFIGVELIVHLALHLRGRPSMYNGLG